MTINSGKALGSSTTVQTRLGPVDCYATGPADAPVLVFVHGLVANADLWARCVPLLSEDHRCLTLDLPLGAHTTPVPRRAPVTPDSAAEAVAEAVRELAPDGCVLVGNDTGGVLCQLVATRHADTVPIDGLVLTSCDTYDNFLPPILRYIQLLARIPGGVWLMSAVLRLRWARRLPIAFRWLVTKPLEPELWDSFLRPVQTDAGIRRDVGGFLRAISIRYTLETAGGLQNFDAPTVLPWADTKRIFPIAHARRLAASMPDATVVPIRDSGALVPLDQPAALADAVRDFVAIRVAPGRRSPGRGQVA
ncbi:alpha/beta fold hydrolase [Yinghuangia seranimata]|uniref:alpha/beta fold hydrolase n=1 Tax=Yinghuangia seranimata TaxID=408067 RepID=UPI00248AE014|nr:alpha/beta hydrolase [Yinghuangia seranimata]MDI2130207.1 alpha/beta hydrolase [Yinghuangia seranimata]